MASTKPSDVSDVKTSLVNQIKTKRDPQPAQQHAFWKVAHALGSLQLAISAGAIFTIAMIIGTCLESWYSDKIAQELIYHTWWFTCLLGLLGSCIFFAAMKKWPWKRHQTGFLITHVGLLTLLAGGVLNSFFGVDAVMRLVDSNIASEQLRVPKKSNEIQISNYLMTSLERKWPSIELVPMISTVLTPWPDMDWLTSTVEVKPGPLPWGTELGRSIPIPGMIRGLAALANPLPRSVHFQPYQDVRLEVIGHLPHCRVEPLEEAPPMAFGFPALKVEINTRDAMRVKPAWIVLNSDRERRLSPWLTGQPLKSGMLVELIGLCHPALIDEFLKPPAADQLGKQGQLVFYIQGQKHRIQVAEQIGKTVSLGQSGWKVAVKTYLASPGSTDPKDAPESPSVLCDVIAPNGKATPYKVLGRMVTHPGPLNALGEQVTDLEEGMPAVWYHAPDIRFGYDGKEKGTLHIKNLLQFAQAFDGKLYFRSGAESDGVMRLNVAEEAPASGIEKKIWEQRAGNFIIEEHVPHAKFGTQRVVPIAKRPGLLDEENPPSILVRLTMTVPDAQGNPQAVSRERWVPLGRRVIFPMAVNVEGVTISENFGVLFGNRKEKLDFAIELTRAESQLDPGTDKAATYTSFVKLFDDKRQIHGENRIITMNEPLDHLGYKVYQSRFEEFGIDEETGKLLAGSVFTIGRDPGLWLKYLGTGMIGLGIATMYYMKAYFFKPKSRRI